jgi:hypothetical protein
MKVINFFENNKDEVEDNKNHLIIEFLFVAKQ